MRHIFTYIFACLMTLLVASMTCFAAAELNITSFSDLNANYNQGIISGSFLATNVGDVNLTKVNFAGNYINGSTITVNYMTVNQDILVGQQVLYNFNISIANQEAKNYLFALSSSAENISSITLGQDTTSTLVISSSKNINASLDTTSITIAKANTRNIVLSIQNTGNTDITSSYSVLANDIGTDVSSKNYSVLYGQTSSINVPIAVGGAVASNSYTLTLRVYYTASDYVDKQFTVLVVDPATSLAVSGQSAAQNVDLADMNTYTFVVSNLGNTQSNFNITLSGLSDFEALTYSPSSFSLGPTSSQTITVTIDNNDEDKRPSDTYYDEEYKGTFTVNSGQNKTNYVLTLKTKTEIEIDTSSVETRVNGAKKSKSIKAMPGDQIEISFDLKNLYSKSDDVEISDYTVYTTIDNIDDGDALELADIEGSDIAKNSEDTITISFAVPYLADKGTYDVDVEVEATDENGNTFFVTYNGVSISVDKDSHKLIYENLKLDSDILTCDYPTLRYTGRLVNVGRNTEKDVLITSEIVGQTRFIVTSKSTIDENSYDTLSEIFQLSDLQKGSYTLRISAVYGSYNVETTLPFRIDCTKQDTVVTVTPQTGGNNVVPQAGNFSDINTGNNDDSPNSTVLGGDIVYITVLIALIVVVLIAILFLITKLIKKV